jgi:sugar lactone lactonase YvrE
MILGSGDYRYDMEWDWGTTPDDWTLGWIGGVATDSQDRVYVYNRGTHPMVVFDPEGNVLSHWGDDFLPHAHGIYIDGDDILWLTDQKAQAVFKCTTDGEILQTIGIPGQIGAEGVPFHDPTDAFPTASGEIFVSDGYGNARCHRFSAAGELMASWGTPGTKTGEFVLPHSVWVDPRDRVWVADRENRRIQLFDRDGAFIEEWTGIDRPTDFHAVDDEAVFVAELDAGIAVLDLDGGVVARFGTMGKGPNEFVAPHGIWVDSQGCLYLCEVQRDDKIHKLTPA